MITAPSSLRGWEGGVDGEGGSEHVLLPDKDLLRFSLLDHVHYSVQAGFPSGVDLEGGSELFAFCTHTKLEPLLGSSQYQLGYEPKL